MESDVCRLAALREEWFTPLHSPSANGASRSHSRSSLFLPSTPRLLASRSTRWLAVSADCGRFVSGLRNRELTERD